MNVPENPWSKESDESDESDVSYYARRIRWWLDCIMNMLEDINSGNVSHHKNKIKSQVRQAITSLENLEKSLDS